MDAVGAQILNMQSEVSNKYNKTLMLKQYIISEGANLSNGIGGPPLPIPSQACLACSGICGTTFLLWLDPI